MANNHILQSLIMISIIIPVYIIIPETALAEKIIVEPGESIQAAIGKAGIGDIIHVSSGVYRESINVSKQITLLGIDRPVIDAQGDDDAVILSANGTALDGFKIANSLNNGIYVLSNNNYIANNTVSDAIDAIFLENSQGNNIAHNHAEGGGLIGQGIALNFSHNNLLINNSATGSWLGSGILLTESSNNTISENSARNGGYGGGGIVLANGSNYNRVTRNEAVGSWNGYGIFLLNSAGNNLEGNNARTTCWGWRSTWTMYWGNGISLQYSNKNVVRNNKAANSYFGFAVFSSDENSLIGNSAAENQNGFGLMSANRNTISGNMVKSNSDYGIGLLDSSYRNVFMNNTIRNNRCGIYFQDSSQNEIFANNSLQENSVNTESLRSSNSWRS